MFQLLKSESTKTGFNFILITAKAVEIIEKVGIITSSFGFKLRAFKATSSAAVPLETAIAYFLLLYFEKFLSKIFGKRGFHLVVKVRYNEMKKRTS